MLAIVVDELKAQGLYEQTTFVFCSDHGQVDIDMSVNANKLLIENGLLTVDEEGNMCGDTEFAEIEPVVDAITPVPGGVGSVTTAILASHVIEAAEKVAK